MAATLGWLAVKGKDDAAVFAELDLVRNGDTSPRARRGFCLALPSGWFVVVARAGSPLLTEDTLLPLSKGCRVVSVQHDETAYSVATCYDDGAVLWHVEHAARDDEVRVLAASGALPPGFDVLHARFESEQDIADEEGRDVDCFVALPVELAEMYTGFEYDFGAAAYGRAAFDGWKLGAEVIPRAASRRLRRRMARSARPWWRFW
ncbi:hypothetical protein P3W24_17840 [Luteibacter sp. PPL201]|uniref:Uncharacterized protein n=1 Tax=Luteibacter sahnii TaxID=3021977 RepID=A0ABT6BFA2_9GAMM|nr:hypothetical protein [Luteibacter sp. PPL193]MDY1549094.1 hypothetical protein [Luteibacter sp. PPL193]